MSAFCVCCLANEELNPLLRPNAGYADILKEFFMIKMLAKEIEPSDILICSSCVSRLEDIRSFKQQIMESIQTLKVSRIIKTRKGKGGYLFVKKMKNVEEIEESTYFTEILDEELLNLDDIDIDSNHNTLDNTPELFVDTDHEVNDIHIVRNDNVTIEIEEEFPYFNYISENTFDTEQNEVSVVPEMKSVNEATLSLIVTKEKRKQNEYKVTKNSDSYSTKIYEDIIDYNILEKNAEIKKEQELSVKLETDEIENIINKIPLSPNKKITVKKKINNQTNPTNKPKKPTDESYSISPDLKCEHCGVMLPNLKMFHNHMNRHFPNHVCSVCGKGFLSARRLKRHAPSHDKGNFECNVCKKIFTNYNTMNSHRQRKHKEVELYKCTMCDERFVTFNRRMMHLSTVHGQSERKYKCDICSMRFLVSGHLSAHNRRVHLDVKRHHCAVCGARFFLLKDLESHQLRHSGARDHQCAVCFKSYPRKNALVVHMKIHSDDKRYKCDECGRKFVQKVSLQSHLKVHEKRRHRTGDKGPLVDENQRAASSETPYQ